LTTSELRIFAAHGGQNHSKPENTASNSPSYPPVTLGTEIVCPIYHVCFLVVVSKVT